MYTIVNYSHVLSYIYNVFNLKNIRKKNHNYAMTIHYYLSNHIHLHCQGFICLLISSFIFHWSCSFVRMKQSKFSKLISYLNNWYWSIYGQTTHWKYNKGFAFGKTYTSNNNNTSINTTTSLNVCIPCLPTTLFVWFCNLLLIILMLGIVQIHA